MKTSTADQQTAWQDFLRDAVNRLREEQQPMPELQERAYLELPMPPRLPPAARQDDSDEQQKNRGVCEIQLCDGGSL